MCIALIATIFYDETSYNRFSRFGYALHIDQEDEISIKMLENEFYTSDNSFNIPTYEVYWRFEKQFAPNKLHLLWFNYNDNKFYEFNGDLPYEKIQKEFNVDNSVKIKFGKMNTFQLIVNDKTIQQFKASEVSKPWFDEYTEREVAVFYANNEITFSPVLNIKSNSRLVKAGFDNTSKNYRRGYRESFQSDSIYNRRFIYDDHILTTKAADYITLELENSNYKHKVGEELYNDNLVYKIEIDSKDLYNILKSNPSKNFDLNINLDEKDSVKSVNLSNQKYNFNLIIKTDYSWN